jgi:hypothetical protein
MEDYELLIGTIMKTIKIRGTSSDHEDVTVYITAIEGVWHRITHIKRPVLDGRHACSGNLHKWDLLGHEHNFEIEPCEVLEECATKPVEDFIHRFKESGNKTANLMERRHDNYYPSDKHPGHTWGWNVERLTGEYIF